MVSSPGRVAHGAVVRVGRIGIGTRLTEGRLIHYTRIRAHQVMKLSRYVLESNPKLVYRQHPRVPASLPARRKEEDSLFRQQEAE